MKKTITINRIKLFFSRQKEGLKKEGNEHVRTDIVNIQIPENKLIAFEKERSLSFSRKKVVRSSYRNCSCHHFLSRS